MICLQLLMGGWLGIRIIGKESMRSTVFEMRLTIKTCSGMKDMQSGQAYTVGFSSVFRFSRDLCLSSIVNLAAARATLPTDAAPLMLPYRDPPYTPAK